MNANGEVTYDADGLADFLTPEERERKVKYAREAKDVKELRRHLRVHEAHINIAYRHSTERRAMVAQTATNPDWITVARKEAEYVAIVEDEIEHRIKGCKCA